MELAWPRRGSPGRPTSYNSDMKQLLTKQNLKVLLIGGAILIGVGHIISFIGLFAIYDVAGKCSAICNGLTWQPTVSVGGLVVAGLGYGCLLAGLVGYIIMGLNKKSV